MCSPRVIGRVKSTVSRRAFLGAVGAAAVASVAAPMRTAKAQNGIVSMMGGAFRVRDLTHTLGPDFPVFPGYDPMKIEEFTTIEEDGFNSKNLIFNEHTGTHMDAPLHFSADGATAAEISAGQFFAPLAVVDISNKAASDEDAMVTVDDLLAWEALYGPLPEGAFVAMYSGWEARLSDPGSFVNADADDTPHFPAFGPEAGEFLLAERNIVGLGVDTLSLDPGISTEFKVHNTVLPAGKYGLENLANLGEVGASGAAIIVGGPKHEGATGGPSRVFAVSSEDGAAVLPNTGGIPAPRPGG